MRESFKREQYGCPVACEYCVITKVDSRRELWNEKSLIGINKAVTILNPPPDLSDKKALDAFYGFPVELLRGDIVGFNAISDPFWPKYERELFYFLEKVAPLAKLVVCVTKFNPAERILQRLREIPNFRLNVSITGLDMIERTKTAQRLALLSRAGELGIKAFPIIHPYIAGMSDLAFLPQLKSLGYDFVDVKGLRYNHENMKHWMPVSSQQYYLGTEEQEILPEDGWREKVYDAGMGLMSLKQWYVESSENLSPNLSFEEASDLVAQIFTRANVTSSDSDEAVRQAAIRRRM